MERREWMQRKLACCDSDPKCSYCPLREENLDKSLKELFDQMNA